MLAASYLPRRWPSKYCHRYESLRPCSGWERVVYSHLATSEFFEYAQNCIKYKLTYHQFNLIQIIALRSVVIHFVLLMQNCRSFNCDN